MQKHIVRDGDCISSLAALYGFKDGSALYDHPENRHLKKKRPNPDLLHPGDVLAIPDPEPKRVSCATGQQHRFEVSRPSKRLHLRLQQHDGQPLKGLAYELHCAGTVKKGTLTEEGVLDEKIPADAHEAVLCVDGTRRQLLIGHLNPLYDADDDGVTGMQARLTNLGYAPGPIDGDLGPRSRASLRRFQAEHELEPTGELCEKTRKKLEERHGC